MKKDIYDKTASDLADWKKKHNALLSDEEKKKQAADEELSALRKQGRGNAERKSLLQVIRQLLALGYDKLAAETARLWRGTTRFFPIKRSFLIVTTKTRHSSWGEGSKPPAGGGSTKGWTMQK